MQTCSYRTNPICHLRFQRISSILLELMLVATVSLTSADVFAACGCVNLPQPNQVTVWRDSDYSGECCTLGVGNYPSSRNFAMPNDSISSLKVGDDVRVVLFEHAQFGGREATYEAGESYASINEVNDETSSIQVIVPTSALSYYYEGNFPRNKETFWSNQGQGIANDGTYWYITTKSEVFQLPINCSLLDDSCVTKTVDISEIRSTLRLPSGYDHLGDPDQYGGYLFVPLEGKDARLEPRVVVLWAQTLAPITHSDVFTGPGVLNCAWVSVDPNTGVLYTSGGTIDADNGLHAHDIDWGRVGVGSPGFLTHREQTFLLDQDGEFISLNTVQGGKILSDSLIYLTNSATGGAGPGLRVFELITGGFVARAGNNYGPFDFQLTNAGSDTGDEAEGIDFLPIRPEQKIPGIDWGDLHVMMIDVDVGHDNGFIKHYSYKCDWDLARQSCIQH
jgi:hypothetical protein